jgi:hypothetical protein
MSWDIYVSGDDRSWETGDSDGAADTIGPLGSVPQVRQRVEAVWPETTWDADGTAWVERADVTAELEVGTDDPVGSLMVRVRGGRDPVRAVLELCHRHRWTPMDTSTGRVLTVQENGYGRWRASQEAAGQAPEASPPAPSPGRRRWGWRR